MGEERGEVGFIFPLTHNESWFSVGAWRDFEMTEEVALGELVKIFPSVDPKFLAVSRDRHVYGDGRVRNSYYVWNYTVEKATIVGSSYRSYEHALAIAKSGNEDVWEAEDRGMEVGE